MKHNSFSFFRPTCSYALLLLMLSALLGTSCKKTNDMELDKGSTPLALTVNRDSIVLEQKNDALDALVFNWTSGSNNGTNASISYTLKLDKQGNNFSNAVTENLGVAARTKKYTVQELNNLLLTRWNATPGVAIKLEAKVIATVANSAVTPDSTSSTIITVTPYRPVTSTLYLIGDAAPNGWDAGNATPMNAVAGQPGKFTWTGNLKTGEFKFITSLGQFLPSYNRGASATTLVYRTADNQPDDKFRVPTPGNYNITVSLLDLSITVTQSTAPPYSRLWIVGDATPNGWNIDNPNQMRVDSSNLYVFTYNEVLKAGEFKIPTSTGNWGTDFYMPASNNQPLSSTAVQLVPGGNPDNKWRITNPGPYKISLDLQNMRINITPFTPYTQLWMVGDATPAGWNIDNPTPLTAVAGDPYKFTYEGPMNAGEFKFPVTTGNWGADFFMPVINQSGPGSTQMKFVPAGNPDFKWRITQAGNYKITVDQLRETISIIKQ